MGKYLQSKDVKVFFAPSLHQPWWDIDRWEQQGDYPLEHIYATSVEISNSVSLSNSYLTERRSPEEPLANTSPRGSIQLSYLLTGQDPLKKYYFLNEKEKIGNSDDASFPLYKNLNFDGFPNMTFKIGENIIRSGYLTSYSLSARPNTPIDVKASISFFHGIEESTVVLDGENNVLPKEVEFLKYDDLTIDNFYYDEPIGITTDNILGLDYSFESSVEPCLRVGEIYPKEIRFGEKNINLTIDTNDTGIKIPYSGEHVNLCLKTHDFNGNLHDEFLISGKLTDKSYSVEPNSKVGGRLNISQSTVGRAPSITYFSVTGTKDFVYPGEYITIHGIGLDTVSEIEMNGSNADISGAVKESEIQYVKIPEDIHRRSRGWTADARALVRAYGIGGPSNSKILYVKQREIS